MHMPLSNSIRETKMMESSDVEQMKKRISELESINDQLSAELRYLDNLLKEVGFEEGLTTLKFAAIELLEEEEERS
jgi:hypothetical protein